MPTKERITDQARDLLTALQEAEKPWLSQADLARKLDKSRLYAWDVQLLDRLISAGAVEKRERENSSPVRIAYEYRAVEAGAGSM